MGLRGITRGEALCTFSRLSIVMEMYTSDASTPYQRLGGEPALRRLVQRFYDLMETAPEGAPAMRLHPPDLSDSRTKTFEFLSGWLGGPDLYIEKRGHPRLRMRHLPFPIGRAEKKSWLWCMYTALDEQLASDPDLRDRLKASFESTADHMQNQP